MWLHDKPQKFTKYCIERLTPADKIKVKNINQQKICDKYIFSLKSSTTSDVYLVDLGNGENLPSCTCIDWKKTLLPCKHMLAVITKWDGMSWLSISSKYRQSPFLILDNEAIYSNNNQEEEEEEEEEEEATPPMDIDDVPNVAFS